MTLVEPLQDCFEWFVTFFYCLPQPVQWFIGLSFFVFLLGSIINLIQTAR